MLQVGIRLLRNMGTNLIVKNCKIVVGEYFEAVTEKFKSLELYTDIQIENGVIVKIEKNISPSGFPILDAEGNYVLPGIVDVHTHMRDPGLCHKEDFTTGSRAAARGGVTTFVDMPNTLPLTSTSEALEEKIRNSKERSYVDYAFHFGGVKTDNSSEISKVSDISVSTKIFLNESTGDMLIDSDSTVENLFNASRIISVHAEGKKVEEAILASEKFDKPLYLCHLSTESELEYLKAAKDRGSKVYGEVTPHHLFLNTEDRDSSDRGRNLLRMKPELKSSSCNELLWKALSDGVLDSVGTDHAPHTLDEKYSKTTFGIPGIENSLEVMLKGVKEDKITLFRLTEVMSSNPAKIFNIEKKGKIEIGYYGDLVIVDIHNSSIIRDDETISKCGWTPYHGMTRGGKVETTIVRGNIVYNRGQFSENLIGEMVKIKK